MGEKFDFSGWATKYNIKCSDGRTIRRDAFKDCDGKKVPLVWGHDHSNPGAVLGHALLEKREEGMYAFCSFNRNQSGKEAKECVEHGDVMSLSIYANQLQESAGEVYHGNIREVSLVLAGANPGAVIENPILAHSGETVYEEAHISYGEDSGDIELWHEDEEDDEETKEVEETDETDDDDEEEEEVDNEMAHADERTVQDVINGMTEEQKDVMYYLVGEALANKGAEGSSDMKHNVFDADEQMNEAVLSHDAMMTIIADAKSCGSLRDSVLKHSAEYGIDQIEYLFPDDKMLAKAPEFIKRETGWVSVFMNAVHHTPFAKVKSQFANITEEDARAKGYIKGRYKKEEVFGLLKRSTAPTTIYKKQKMDRDDIIDINDFDVVAWLKTEMRMMLDEEIARACLVGDGRSSASDDKVNEQNIRPIWKDDDLFTIKCPVNVVAGASEDAIAKATIRTAIRMRKAYKGSGNPTFYTTDDVLTTMLLLEDGFGHDLYKDEAELCKKLRVSKIVTVPVMEGLSRIDENGVQHNLLGIIVNPVDYNIGADKGGSVNMFEDFDIDYNQEKYLIETRCSGALIKPFSAMALELTYAASLTVSPDDPDTTRYGKTVSDLQSNVVVNDNFIEGTLKYVTGYTGFSGLPAEQSGNYLALKFVAAEGSTNKIFFNGHEADLGDDMYAVIRVTSNTQKIKVVSTLNGDTTTKEFGLKLLKLESAENVG